MTGRRQIQVQGELYSGPLPAPDDLLKYDQIVPGAAERLIQMAERQMEHRHKLELIVVSGGSKRAWVGLFFAFLLGLSGILGGIYLISEGKDISGLATVISSAAALIGVFIYGKRSESKQRNRQVESSE
ncbi:MAG: DUF2335 domain-containing protein [Leptospiraceae bacterium]|nr:DUF2335 domain-containing protein [Leptospiraceae bacterium]